MEAIERDFVPEAVKCMALNADEIARHQLNDPSKNCTFSKAVCRVKGGKRQLLAESDNFIFTYDCEMRETIL